MKRGQRWSPAKRGGEGHPESKGGPLRRRRLLRHLDGLALDPGRAPNPSVATAHVRVIGQAGDANSRPGVLPQGANRAQSGPPPSKEPADEAPDLGARVQALPIDQPFRAEPAS